MMILYGALLIISPLLALVIGYSALRRQMQSEMAALRKLIDEGRPRSAAAVLPLTAAEAGTPVASPKPEKRTHPPKSAVARDEVTPDILAVIAAAVAQFVGAGARIRSTRVVPVLEGNAWAQQGRVIVQASHNLAVR
jgi:hypothetical protein